MRQARGRRQVGERRQRAQPELTAEVLQQRRDRRPDVARVGGEVGAEQQLGHDVQRQRHHVLVHVARLARSPAGDRLVRQLRHDAAVGAQLALVKRGLHQPALPPPQLAFADDQTRRRCRARASG